MTTTSTNEPNVVFRTTRGEHLARLPKVDALEKLQRVLQGRPDPITKMKYLHFEFSSAGIEPESLSRLLVFLEEDNQRERELFIDVVTGHVWVRDPNGFARKV